MPGLSIATKRVYDPPGAEDGKRVLVDRLWPRGVSGERAKLDAWMKEVAPSTELREWYHADRSRWDGFRTRYLAELEGHREELAELAEWAKQGTVTLLYASRDAEKNHAMIVRELLGSMLRA